MSELQEILARRRRWEESGGTSGASQNPAPIRAIPKPSSSSRPVSLPPSFIPVTAVQPPPLPPSAQQHNRPVSYAAAPATVRTAKPQVPPPPIPANHPAPSNKPASSYAATALPVKSSSFRSSAPPSAPRQLQPTAEQAPVKPAFVLRPSSGRALKTPISTPKPAGTTAGGASSSPLVVANAASATPAHPPPPPPPPLIIQGSVPPTRITGLRPDSWIKTSRDDSTVKMRELFRRSNSGSETEVQQQQPPPLPTFALRRSSGDATGSGDNNNPVLSRRSSSETNRRGSNDTTRRGSNETNVFKPQPSVRAHAKPADKPPGSPLQSHPTTTQDQPPSNHTQRHVTSKEFAQALGVMEDLREKLVQFYEVHNKLKLASVDKILASFGMRGREQGELQLNQALMREYGVDLHSPSANLITFTKALYRFTPLQDGDLPFEAGQIIQVTDSSKDWWFGSYKLGDKTLSGVFPKNYVQGLSEDFVLETLAKQESKRDLDEYSPEAIKEDIFASHYFKSVLEVVTSEFKYVVDLFTVNEVFVTKFQANPAKAKYATELFPSWISIVYAHENILGRLIEALPDPHVVESSFTKRASNSSSSSAAGGGGDRKSLSQPVGESLIKQVCGDSAAKLNAFQAKLEYLELTYSDYLESGKGMSTEQRKLRIDMISQWVCRQSKELSNLIPFLKMSNQFILQYHSTLKKLEQFTGEDLLFIDKLESHPVMKTMKLRDFLIKPIQRVCKYPLLYREIIKYAPEEETRHVAKQTQDKFMLITEHVNHMIKQSELGNAKRLAELLTWIYPPADLQRYDLHVPHTLLTLRREGELTVVSHPQDDTTTTQLAKNNNLSALLITDSLFFCEKQTITRLLTKPEHRVRIHHVIRLCAPQYEKITVNNSSCSRDDTLELVLLMRGSGREEQKWILKFPSQASRDGWVEDLNAAVERSEAVRNREREAQKQEEKIERQRNARGSGLGSTPMPEPPRRQGVLMGLMDELKYVQVLKGVSKDEV